jgi:hypothetical protein
MKYFLYILKIINMAMLQYIEESDMFLVMVILQ